MKRHLTKVLLAAALALLAGCSDSDFGDASLRHRVIGSWELFRQSEDHGNTWQRVDNGFAFSLLSDGRSWIDTDGHEGDYVLEGDRLTIYETREPNLYFRVRMFDGDRRLRLTFYRDHRFNVRTGEQSDYDRIRDDIVRGRYDLVPKPAPGRARRW